MIRIRYQLLLGVLCCNIITHIQTTAWLLTKETVTSFAQTIVPYLTLAPTVLCLARAITATEHRLGFTQTMLTGQLATLAALCWRQQKKSPVAQTIPVEPVTKLGYLQLSGTVLSTEKFHEALKKCLDDTKIKGIILKIDAEWGELGICQTMFKELKRASEQKPVIALIEKSCCREPYLIATASHCIIANEHATIGMIGTALWFSEQRPDPAKELSCFYAGRMTPLGDSNHHLTPQEQQLIAEQIELHYQHMCATIAEQRKLDLAQLASWAEGKPFLGLQALDAHLIDYIGTLSDAYEVMQELLAEKHEPFSKKFNLIPFTI